MDPIISLKEQLNRIELSLIDIRLSTAVTQKIVRNSLEVLPPKKQATPIKKGGKQHVK